MSSTFSKPDFLVIGPFRTGTTWLYSQLCHVWGVKMPPYKEISFFYEADRIIHLKALGRSLAEGTYRPGLGPVKMNEEVKQKLWGGYDTMRNENFKSARRTAGLFWACYYKLIPRRMNTLGLWMYSKLFPQSLSELTGDVSPAYFALSPAAIEKIKSFFPQLKIIAIIRDPVERDWSNISMQNKGKRITEEIVNDYLQQSGLTGDYITALQNWERIFGTERMGYFFYDDLVANPERFIEQVMKYLKPDAKVLEIVKGRVGEGTKAAIPDEMRRKLIEKNLPQYTFLADKFGEGSHAANWLKYILQSTG